LISISDRWVARLILDTIIFKSKIMLRHRNIYVSNKLFWRQFLAYWGLKRNPSINFIIVNSTLEAIRWRTLLENILSADGPRIGVVVGDCCLVKCFGYLWHISWNSVFGVGGHENIKSQKNRPLGFFDWCSVKLFIAINYCCFLFELNYKFIRYPSV
jgi:hypothetical protein